MVFIPTYLYIKQHAITGKLYFGKTVKNPLTYKGSGKQWLNHINHHSKEHVVTLWYQLYDNVFDLVADALSMSYSLDIKNSKTWLNLKDETGLDGGTWSFESKLKLSIKSKNKVSAIDTRTNIRVKISKEEFDSNPHYVGVNHGKSIFSVDIISKKSKDWSGNGNPKFGKPNLHLIQSNMNPEINKKRRETFSINAKLKMAIRYGFSSIQECRVYMQLYYNLCYSIDIWHRNREILKLFKSDFPMNLELNSTAKVNNLLKHMDIH